MALDLHAEVVIGLFVKIVERLALARIIIGQLIAKNIRQVLRIIYACPARVQRIIRHELPVLAGIRAAGYRTELLVDFEMIAVQMREVLRTVKLVIPASVIDAFNKQMIDSRRIIEQLLKASACDR